MFKFVDYFQFKLVMKNKIKSFLKVGAGFIIGTILGLSILPIITSIASSSGSSLSDMSGFEFIISFSALLIFAFMSIFIHTILHETGHLIGGLLAGFKFLSFRFFRWVLISEGGKLKIKNYNISGTGGQCLMYSERPITSREFSMYIAGGVVVNLMVVVLSVLYLSLFGIKSLFPGGFIAIMGIIGLLLALSNGLPVKMGGIPVDGYYYWRRRNDNEFLELFTKTLKINAEQTSGTRLANMPEHYFVNPNFYTDNSDKLMAASIFVSHMVDTYSFEDAQKNIEAVIDINGEDNNIYNLELKCDYLYCELMINGFSAKSKSLYDSVLKTYINNNSKFQTNKIRIKHAIELFSGNEAAAGKLRVKIEKLAEKYPNKGEALQDLDLINKTIEIYESTKEGIDNDNL